LDGPALTKKNTDPNQHPAGKVGEFFANLGPGLITGAADDDPSGISTYSVAGAAFGYLPLWTALFSFPLMAAVQLMCARLGLVTGRGLAGVIRHYYPRWVLWGACSLLIVANVFNIGADLGGMADATALVTGVSSFYWTPIFTVLIIVLLIFSSYRLIAKIFKWLTLILFSYILTAFLAQPDWRAVFTATFIPQVLWTSAFLAAFVGILGTTISPYLFFWQASQEVDEERTQGKSTIARRRGASDEELRIARTDVLVGMFFSNLVMYFIILTTASTLHAHGITDIQTAQQAALALRPLAGQGAYLLFTLSIIGTGMLAVPVLSGSAAYAIAEAEQWRGNLESRPNLAKRFYAVVAISMLLGLALDFVGFNAVKMLFYSAVLNGILAPPLIVLVTLLTSNPKVMGKRVSSPLLRFLGWGTAAIMTVAAIGMFLTL
jgi:NRAMP (natural resistance-associated macrophage protein)-like metal ion transporter